MSGQIYKEVWQFAMQQLQEEYKAKNNEDEFKMWFNMQYVDDTIDTINVSVASIFMQQMMQSKGYFDIVKNKINTISGQNINICAVVKSDNTSNSKENILSAENKETPASEGNFSRDIKAKSFEPEEENFENNSENEENNKNKVFKKHPLLKTEFTFETFIPGENCNFAYNAALAISKNPGKQYNPVLIYGGSGLGKTHLMQAIGNYIYNNGGEKLKIYYGTVEAFANEYTLAMANKKIPQFNDKFRNLDVLLLDDIHFLEDKKGFQEELFYTFNALHERNAQMVFTCDRPVREVKNMADRLVSRLSNGLCIDITIPNYETRIAIIQKKIEFMGKTLSQDIINYIAKNVETNVRDIESALNRIFGYEELTGQELTLEIVQSQLRDLLKKEVNENINLEIIQKVIADNFNISLADIKSKKKDKKFVFPRQIAIYIARNLLEISYKELGAEFGGKDHSTIMHSYEKMEEAIKTDANLESKIKIYIKQIKEYKSNK
ncbi:MAG: chromosomal replication initiator protein DnaA [Treponema sp.]|nr:chromosomal replication initiator protein DnaA [Treponema sp.]